MGKMRYPSLSIHGIEGAFSAAGAKTVIPAKISGRYSGRVVVCAVLRVKQANFRFAWFQT
jgi:hypothetical protein